MYTYEGKSHKNRYSNIETKSALSSNSHNKNINDKYQHDETDDDLYYFAEWGDALHDAGCL